MKTYIITCLDKKNSLKKEVSKQRVTLKVFEKFKK